MKSILNLSGVILFLYLACNSPQAPKIQQASLSSSPYLIGKTIQYQYGEDIYHVTIDSDSTMHWEAIAGEEKGVKYEERYIAESILPNILFITWGEANGIGVSQVLDFNKGTVYNHLLRGRKVNAGMGTIKIIPKSY